MTASINTLKTIENGTKPDADEVMDNFGFILSNMLTLIKDGAVSTNQTNYYAPALSSGDYYTTSAPSYGLSKYIMGTSYSSDMGDTTHWTTTGSVSSMRIENNATAYTKGSGDSLDFKTENCATAFYIQSGGAYYGPACLEVTNGTTDALIENLSNGYAFYELVFKPSTNEVRVWKNGVEMGSSPFDLSSVTTNWYIKVTGGGDVGAYLILGNLSKIVATTVYNVYTANTSLASSTSFCSLVDVTNPNSSTIVYNYSIDNGVGYSTFTPKIFTKSSAFTQLKFKITGTQATIDTTKQNCIQIGTARFYHG